MPDGWLRDLETRDAEKTQSQAAPQTGERDGRGFWSPRTPGLLNALGNYQADYQTSFDAIAEIEWRVDNQEPGALTDELIRSSKTFRIAIDRDLVPNQ